MHGKSAQIFMKKTKRGVDVGTEGAYTKLKLNDYVRSEQLTQGAKAAENGTCS